MKRIFAIAVFAVATQVQAGGLRGALEGGAVVDQGRRQAQSENLERERQQLEAERKRMEFEERKRRLDQIDFNAPDMREPRPVNPFLEHAGPTTSTEQQTTPSRQQIEDELQKSVEEAAPPASRNAFRLFAPLRNETAEDHARRVTTTCTQLSQTEWRRDCLLKAGDYFKQRERIARQRYEESLTSPSLQPAPSSPTYAPAENWLWASNTGTHSTGDTMVYRCSYRTSSGLEFSVLSRNGCRSTARYNPETQAVRF